MAATDARDTADGALLLLFVDRTYGPERAAAVVAACSRFVAEREREIPPEHEPERDTQPAALFWCECLEPLRQADKPELCATCAKLLRPGVDAPTQAMCKCPCGYHGPLNADGSCPRCGADE